MRLRRLSRTTQACTTQVCTILTSTIWMRASALALGPALLSTAPFLVQAQTLEQSSAYVSATDQALTIRKVAVLPVTDNLDGIYARPIETQLTNLVRAYHQWDFVEGQSDGSYASLDELEENPDQVRKLTASIEADAFLVAKASKGPNGLSIKLDLFLKNDGKLLAQEALKDHPRFDLGDMKQQVDTLFRKIARRIPYDGLILSRQGNRVTVNLGKSDGISPDQVLAVIQIIKVTRHPKFGFLVSSEKEILGKIKIMKIDETLSFGTVISELDKGVIRPLHKISGLDQISYPVPEDLSAGSLAGDSVLDRPESEMTFGKNPEEWKPTPPPSFGSIALRLGLGQYNQRVSLSSQSLEAKDSFYPSLNVAGELWLNPNWTVRAEIDQGVVETKNPRAGSTPTQLSHSLSKYMLALGYNFLLQEDFFGPKLQIRGGFMSYRSFVDDSTPVAFTTATYSGFLIGLAGSLPVTEKRDWYLSASVNMTLFPSLQEKPVTSGGSNSNTINDFSLSIEKKLKENLRAVGSVDISVYSTSFAGTGTRPSEYATSMSQSSQRIGGGVVYMF